ncbi:MAG: flagellar assembly protein FliX [Pseudolabrys sp.]
MRITGPNATARAATTTSSRRAASGTFSVNEQDAPRNTAAASGLRAVTSLDALIALQGVEDPTERKKRAVGRGRHALDVLDALKVAVLDGDLESSVIGRLKAASEGLKAGSGDPGLDGVLAEIDLRVAVELAKAGVR